MSRFRKALCIALVLLLLVASVPAVPVADLGFGITASALNANGSCGDNATYTFDSATGKLVISGTGPMTDYEAVWDDLPSPFYKSEIKSLVVEDGITTIGEDAFYNCDNLTSVVIGDSVTTIGEDAFRDCDNLTSVAIGDSVTTIGEWAFCDCDNLTSVIIPDNVITIDSAAFFSCDNLTSAVIGNGVTTIGDSAFEFCDNLTSVVIGNGVTTIECWAFGYCNNLTSVTVGNSVKIIYDGAFINCTSLKSINIPKTVTYIGGEAFNYCSGLTDVYYEGTEEDWNAIGTWNNTGLENTTIHFAETVHEHEPTWVSAEGPTCKQWGYIEHYKCPCGKFFEDEECTVELLWEEIEIPVDPSAHNFNGNKCIFCGVYSGCEHKKAEFYNGKSATCEETGLKDYYYCYDCDEYLSDDSMAVISKDEMNIPALGHEWADSTCTEPKKCTREGCTATEGTPVPHDVEGVEFTKYDDEYHTKKCVMCGIDVAYTKHTFDESVVTKVPTCTEKGEAIFKCYDCGATKVDTLDVLNHDTTGVAFEKVNADKHGKKCKTCNNFVEKEYHAYTETVSNTLPTCVTEGSETKKCVCGDTRTVVIPMNDNHDWGTWIEILAPTCTTDGSKEGVCRRTGCTDKVTAAVDALGHDFVYGKCIRCGDYEYGCNHIWGEWVITTAANCTTTGLKERKCTRAGCGEIEKEVLPLKNHYYDVKITYPTCTKDGYSTYTCTVCNDSYVAKKVERYGHDYEETYAEEPTCTQDGYFEYSCTRCGDWYSKTLESYGHDFDYIEDFASCTEDGYYEYYCVICGYSESGVIEAYGHTYPDQWSVIIPATCKETGVAVKVCFDCHEVIAQVVPKVGHSDFDGDSKCDTCGGTITVVEPEKPAEKPEEKPCNCDCHAGGIKAFFFKLINFFAKIFDKNARVCDCGKAH